VGAEGSHPGKNQTRRLPHLLRIGAYQNLGAHMLEGFLDGAQVSRTVVDDVEEPRSDQSTPFVEGMPVARGSNATASRRAFPNALNTASIM
jgi:hypothetical protein